MFKFLPKILKRKKEIRDDLDRAISLGLITQEELLRLRSERADAKLKHYLKQKK